MIKGTPMSKNNIRWGTDLITFYNPGYWGLDVDLGYHGFVAEVNANPRHYFDGMLDGAQEAHLAGVEFGPAPGGWSEALKAYGSTAAVREELGRRDLVLSSSYMAWWELIGNDLNDLSREADVDAYAHEHAEFARQLGCTTIVMGTLSRAVVGSFDTVTVEAFERVAHHLNRIGGVVGEYGAKLAIHTDAYSVCCRPDDIDTLMRMTDRATVQLCPDAGQLVLDGVDPCEVLRRNVARVPLMHWKDCIGELPGRNLPADTIARHDLMLERFRALGSGVVDWHEWMQILADAAWQGWAVAEIDMSPDPITELRSARRYFDDQLAGIHS
jgi:inosose dehydratase